MEEYIDDEEWVCAAEALADAIRLLDARPSAEQVALIEALADQVGADCGQRGGRPNVNAPA